MRDYLVFRLYGPMAAWGEIAVGEYRPSFAHPSKSAIIGLLAAALGIRREEEDRQKSLADSCLYAVRTDAIGTLLRDYHTIQVPSSGTGRNRKVFYTRRAELSETKLNTILSSRDYRCDAVYTVAVSIRDGSSVNAQQLAEALRKPVFTLYLGRKSCPLALPLAPRIIPAATVKEAMEEFNIPKDDIEILVEQESCAVFWEGDHGGYHPEQIISRRDMPLSRTRWQFAERKENFATLQKREG
jgi:CRISPR system Cascade subunit CasD